MSHEATPQASGTLAGVRRNMAAHFDLEELRSLCADLDVDYDDLRGEGKSAKIRELVAYLERADRLPDLFERCRQARPGLDWPDLLVVEAKPRRTVRRFLPGVVASGLLTSVMLLMGGIWAASRIGLGQLPAPNTAVCLPAAEPVRLDMAQLKCPADLQFRFSEAWSAWPVTVRALDQPISSSEQARAQMQSDLVVWGDCQGREEVRLTFELLTTRKPDELYEPGSLTVTGNVTLLIGVGQALISYQHGDYVTATRQLAQTPLVLASPELVLLQANSLLLAKRYEEAITAYKEALKLKPNWSAAYNNRGVAHLNKERQLDKSSFEEADSDWSDAIEWASGPDDQPIKLLAYVNRSEGRNQMGKTNEAKADCDQALVIDGQSALAHVCHAAVGLKTGELAASIQDRLNQAEQAGHVPATFFYLRGVWNEKRAQPTQPQQAIENYRLFLKRMEHRACLATDLLHIQFADFSLGKLAPEHVTRQP